MLIRKNILSSISVTFFLVILFVTFGFDNYANATSFNTYQNANYGFSVDYPSGWIVDDEPIHEENWVNIVAFFPQGDFKATSIQVTFVSNDNEFVGLSENEFLNKMVENTKDWCGSTTFYRDGFICKDFVLVDSKLFDNNMHSIAYAFTQTFEDGTTYNKFESLSTYLVGNNSYTILLETATEESFFYASSLVHTIDSFQLIEDVGKATSNEPTEIPPWIRTVAGFWNEGLVTDEEFSDSMTFLIDKNILQVDLPNDPNLLFFQVVYYTSEESCTSKNYNEMMFYTEAAHEYLLNYGYASVNLAPTCLSIHNQEYYDLNNLYDDVDLFITIRDNAYGTATLLDMENLWGYEEPLGNGQFVVDLCACVVEIESQWGIMLLTHELSHFVIDHRLMPEDLHYSWVHKIHDEIDVCTERYGPGCVFDYEGENYIELRGIRFDVMPYIT